MKGTPREQAVLNVLSQYTLTPEQEADVRQRVASRWASDAEVMRGAENFPDNLGVR